MSDRLGSLLKEAADDSLGDARLQLPTELPESPSGHRRMWLAAAAAVILVAGGLGAWALGSGAPTVDVDTPPAQEVPSRPPDDPEAVVRAALDVMLHSSYIEEVTTSAGEPVSRFLWYRPSPTDRVQVDPDALSLGFPLERTSYLDLADTGDCGTSEIPGCTYSPLGRIQWEVQIEPSLEVESFREAGLPSRGLFIVVVDQIRLDGQPDPSDVCLGACRILLRLDSGRVASAQYVSGLQQHARHLVDLRYSFLSVGEDLSELAKEASLRGPTTTALPPTSWETAPGNWPGLGGPLMMAAYEPGTPIGEIGGLPEALDFLGVDYDLGSPMPAPDINLTVVLESDGYLELRLDPFGTELEIRDVNYIREGMDRSESNESQSGRGYSAQQDDLDLGACEAPRVDLAARYGVAEVREVWIDRPCPALLVLDRPMDQPGWIIERYGPEGGFTMVEAYILPPGDGGAG